MTMKCVLGNVPFIFRYITADHMYEKETCQLSPASHYIYKAQCMLVINQQKGQECGFVGISKCKTGLSSPLLGCCYLRTE